MAEDNGEGTMSLEKKNIGNVAVQTPDMVPAQKTFEPFAVPETPEGYAVACGIALTEEDKRKRLAIVKDRYVRAGYVLPDDPRLENSVFIDEYEGIAVPIVAKIGAEVAASLRLIPNSPAKPLPINAEEAITIDAAWQEKASHAAFEWSQLAKSSRFVRDRSPVMGIIRAAFAYSREQGVNDGVAVIDKRVMELLNGEGTHFALPNIGPAVDYMGSSSVPIYINFDTVIKNTFNHGHKELAQFLDTGKAEGYEWYVGR